jgi:hypothetical protein
LETMASRGRCCVRVRWMGTPFTFDQLAGQVDLQVAEAHLRTAPPSPAQALRMTAFIRAKGKGGRAEAFEGRKEWTRSRHTPLPEDPEELDTK